MSIRQLIQQFREAFEVSPATNFVSDAQRRRWLKTALKEISRLKPLERATAEVSIVADDPDVVLPRDYFTATEEALLAVEYFYSSSFLSQSASPRGSFYYEPFSSINSSLDYPGSRKRAVTPPPEVKAKLVYGVRRSVLRLHVNSRADRTETLLYDAFYSVEDPRVEITVVTNPNPGDELEIVIDEDTFTYTFSIDGAGDDEIKIGATQSGTARNIANFLELDGVLASFEGQVVTLTLFEESFNLSVTTDGERLITESFDMVNNLDPHVEQRVFAHWSAQQYSYLQTEPSFPADVETRRFFAEKARDLKAEALDNLGVCTG